MKSLMKLGEGHEQRGEAMGTGSGPGRWAQGWAGGSPHPHSNPLPVIPLMGREVERWSHKYVQNSEEAEEGSGVGVSERGQGQAQAGATLVRGPWLLGWPWGSWGVPWLAAVLAEVAVALDVGTHQVAHLHGVDLPTFAVADLGSEGQLPSLPAPPGPRPPGLLSTAWD